MSSNDFLNAAGDAMPLLEFLKPPTEHLWLHAIMKLKLQ